MTTDLDTFHIDVYYRHSDDFPPEQIIIAALDGECPEEELQGWIAAAEEAVEDEEEEGVYQVSLIGTPDDVALSVMRVAALEQAVALVSACLDQEGEVQIEDVHIDPLMAAVDPAVMEAIADCAADALESVEDDSLLWVFVAL